MTWNNRLVPNRKRSTSRLYNVTCLFNLYAEYIMWNVGLVEAQAGIKIAGRNINILSYVDDTTLMAESQGKLKSLLMKVKEESETADLKVSVQKPKIMASGPTNSWQIDGEKWKQWETILGGSKITADGDCNHEIKRPSISPSIRVFSNESVLLEFQFQHQSFQWIFRTDFL